MLQPPVQTDPALIGGTPLPSVLTGVTFRNNSAQSMGGGIVYPDPIWAPQISNCTFDGNSISAWTVASNDATNPKSGTLYCRHKVQLCFGFAGAGACICEG